MNPEWRKEYWASLALRHTSGLGPRTWKRLLVQYQSPYSAVADARSWLKKKLVREAQSEAFLSEGWREKAQKEWSLALACGYGVLLWNDERYPERLRQIPDPPVFLYYLGDKSLFSNPGVAVVGSRSATKQGRESCHELCRRLSRAGVTVISGLAWGIDRQAHLGGLLGAGSTIAVLGTGLDLVYPADNRDIWMKIYEQGLLVSEFGPGAPPDPRNFPRRNRIISGLSMGVVVAEAPEKSGALITAHYALETGREVFAMAGPENTPSYLGCRQLIEDGATSIRGADDVLMALTPLLAAELVRVEARPERNEGKPFLGINDFLGSEEPAGEYAPQQPRVKAEKRQVEPVKEEAVSGNEREEDALIRALGRGAKVHIDVLSRSLGWEAGKGSRLLVTLELQGLVRQWPGMNYSAA